MDNRETQETLDTIHKMIANKTKNMYTTHKTKNMSNTDFTKK